MVENNSNPGGEEIDLGYLFGKIGALFKSLIRSAYRIFNFYYQHKYILLGLMLITGFIGYLVQKKSENLYTNQLIVQPNFGSTEYLYKKINALNKKTEKEDSVFLKSIFEDNWKKVGLIEVTPVNDVYEFVLREEVYKETFKLLLEEEGSLDFTEDPINIRMYRQHTIDMQVKGELDHVDLVEKLMTYLGNNSFFEAKKNVSLLNYKDRIKNINKSLQQIDSVIFYYDNDKNINLASEGISFNGVQDFNALIVRKEFLQKEKLNLNILLETESKVMNLVDANYQIITKKDFLHMNKLFLFPTLIVIIYSLIYFLVYLRRTTVDFISE